MKTISILPHLALFVALAMCSQQADKIYHIEGTTVERSAYSCLKEFTGEKEGKFFTEQLIRDLANGNEITPDHYEPAQQYKFHWKENGVIHFIGFEAMQTASELHIQQNQAQAQNSNPLIDYAKMTYRDKTPEEQLRLNRLLDEQLDKSEEPSASSTSDKSLQENVTAMETMAYVPLESGTDYAVYNRKSFSLYVVLGDALLTLNAQVGPYGSVDESRSIELAKKLADKLSELCN
ncbi:hypothetical protein SAMN04489724_0248 [Algoriphagus locisalis]|uniref:DUF4136 domain-containing protein n=1 Tax=Algoriphagus locisalis TaxID=305507 RepID=A0A1I7E8I9_9BACT|nr:hypothetical protein [Algoriphagus locisalis]SFU20133.1 hypothetical protein SAMN04489724_0248 [Algoriphagus locisalis]